AAPPGISRSRRRKSMPFITGMFQSSRMPSGICRSQAASAAAPSSASSTMKRRPWSMREATFLKTRESSTTRKRRGAGEPGGSARGICNSVRKAEKARNVEDDEQLSLELVDARRDVAPEGVERPRVALAGGKLDRQHLADLVDEQAVELVAMVDDDAHPTGGLGRRCQPEPLCAIDLGDDPPV